jgi:cytochrome b561
LVSAAIIPIPTRLFDLLVIPNLVGVDAALAAGMTIVHIVVSRLLIVLLLVHVGAAIKHHFIDRDEVLARMIRLR